MDGNQVKQWVGQILVGVCIAGGGIYLGNKNSASQALVDRVEKISRQTDSISQQLESDRRFLIYRIEKVEDYAESNNVRINNASDRITRYHGSQPSAWHPPMPYPRDHSYDLRYAYHKAPAASVGLVDDVGEGA